MGWRHGGCVGANGVHVAVAREEEKGRGGEDGREGEPWGDTSIHTLGESVA